MSGQPRLAQVAEILREGVLGEARAEINHLGILRITQNSLPSSCTQSLGGEVQQRLQLV